MKVNELRIGNWVMGYHNPFKWSLEHFDLLKQADLDEIIKEPVLITEEILLKCGFEQSLLDSSEFSIGAFECIIKEDGCGAYFRLCWMADIKHLHQLQNLYFAITGEELKVEL